MNVSKALTFPKIQRVPYYMVIFPKFSSDTPVHRFQPTSRYYKVISLKLSSDTPEPLFQPKSRHYMIIFPTLSLDTLGVLSELTLQFGQIG